MPNLADWLYAKRKTGKGYAEARTDWKPRVIRCDNRKTASFCFFPKIVLGVSFLRKGLIPRTGVVFIYTVSSFDLIQPIPEVVIQGLTQIYDDALARMVLLSDGGYSLNMLGISLGNVLSIRLASEAKRPIQSLVSLLGGGELGLSGWDSILTGHIARQSGCPTAEAYESTLRIFSPTTHTPNIRVGEVIVRLATSDLLIPFVHGKSLRDAFLRRSREWPMKIDYLAYPGVDHCGGLFLASLENILRNKWFA